MKIPFKNLIHKIKSKTKKEKKEEKFSQIGLCLFPDGVRIVKCVKEEDDISVEFIAGKDFDKNLFTEQKFNEQFKEYLSELSLSDERVNIGLKSSDFKEKYKVYPKVEEEELIKMVDSEKKTGEFEFEKEIIDYAVMNDKNEQFLVMLIGVPKDFINRIVNFVQDFSLSPYSIEIPQCALKRLLVYNEDIDVESNCLVINDNIDNLSISLYQGVSLIFNRKIYSIGGSAMNKAISKKIDVSLMEAKEIRKEFDLEEVKESGNNSIFNAVKDVLMRRVVELERSIQYFINENPDSDIYKIFITGPSLIKNIDGYLAKKLNIKVELIDPFKNLKIKSKKKLDAEEYSPSSFVIATGLALRGLIE